MSDISIELDHLSLNVADLDASVKFYCEGLGFKAVGKEYLFSNNVDDPDGIRIQRDDREEPGGRTRVRYVKGHGFLLVFNHHEASANSPHPPRSPHGFSNWGFNVDNLEAVIDKLCAVGGTLKHDSRVSWTQGDVTAFAAVVLDPDGEYVEVVERRPRAS